MGIRAEIDAALHWFPDLLFDEELNELSGSLDVGQNDVYEVRIALDKYPTHFPQAWETNERIPKVMHRHIYSDTGSCCFTTAAKAQILLKTKVKSLLSFFEDILIPYLRNNSYYEINGCYSTSEYSHNRMGIVEAYQDILGISNIPSIINLIHGRIYGVRLKPKHPCYCGSGQLLKSCNSHRHYKAYRDFWLIEKGVLYADMNNVFANLKKREH